jgi:hypothetical protein
MEGSNNKNYSSLENLSVERSLKPSPTPNDARPEDMDDPLARELNEMSPQEREMVYEEIHKIHGVDQTIDETPALLAEKLKLLDQELRKISNKPAYDRAERISKEYVTDTKFRLMFLRAEYFDAEKAGIRLVKFMDEKLAYFGPEVLARPIYFDDLNKDEQNFVQEGHYQLLPVRDLGDRVVFVDSITSTRPYNKPEVLVRSIPLTLTTTKLCQPMFVALFFTGQGLLLLYDDSG